MSKPRVRSSSKKWEVGALLESPITFMCFYILSYRPSINFIRLRSFYEGQISTARVTSLRQAGYRRVNRPARFAHFIKTKSADSWKQRAIANLYRKLNE